MSEYEVIDNTNVRQFESEGGSTFEVIGDVKVREFTGGSSSGGSLPEVDSGDDGKSLVVEDGEWKASDANLITGSGSGSVVSFDDALAMPVKSLKMNVDPVQAGSGDPSPENVRPISGWDVVNVYVTGKNLCSTKITDETFYDNNGATHEVVGDALKITTGSGPSSGVYIKANVSPISKILKLLGNEVKNISFDAVASVSTPVRVTSGTGTNLTIGTTKSRYSVPSTGVNFNFYSISTPSVIEISNLQIELGSTATSYDPYTGTVYPISLPQTVYGGTLDVETGTLTVTKKMKTFNGSDSEGWTLIATNTRNSYRAFFHDSKKATPSSIMDMLTNSIPLSETSEAASTSEITCRGTAYESKYFYIFAPPSEIGDVNALKSYLSQHPLQVVYPLATPLTLSLTPTEVRTILGYNNVYADSGDVDVVYYRGLESVANQGKMYYMDSNNAIVESRKLFADVLNGFSPSIKSSSGRVYHMCFVDANNTNAYFMYMNFSATNTLKCQRVVISNSGTVRLENEYTISVTPVSNSASSLSLNKEDDVTVLDSKD